jgi:PIN domain nuclease of toxin-antitoxin system
MGQPAVILVDTHVVIWLAMEPTRISQKARTAITDTRRSGQGIAISDITLFEISTQHRKGRLKLSAGLGLFLSEVESRFVVLPVTGKICVRASEFPTSYPRDPADQIIGATALTEGVPLVTADEAIRKAKAFPTIW